MNSELSHQEFLNTILYNRGFRTEMFDDGMTVKVRLNHRKITKDEIEHVINDEGLDELVDIYNNNDGTFNIIALHDD